MANLSTKIISVWFLCGLYSSVALAVVPTVSQVKKDRRQIVVVMTVGEVQNYELGEQLTISIGQIEGLVNASVIKRNASKGLLMLEFGEPLLKVRPGDLVYFPKPSHDSLFSARQLDFSQRPQQADGSTSPQGIGTVAIGRYVDHELRTQDGNATVKKRVQGQSLGVDVRLPLYPQKFGIGFGLERFDGLITDPRQDGSIQWVALKPGFWYALNSSWALGAQLDYLMLNQTEKMPLGRLEFDYQLSILTVGMTYQTSKYEVTLSVQSSGRFTSRDTMEAQPNVSGVTVNRGLKIPAEVSLAARWYFASKAYCRFSVGAILYDRKDPLVEAFRRTRTWDEKLLFSSAVWYQLQSTLSLATTISYAGSTKFDPLLSENGVNLVRAAMRFEKQHWGQQHLRQVASSGGQGALSYGLELTALHGELTQQQDGTNSSSFPKAPVGDDIYSKRIGGELAIFVEWSPAPSPKSIGVKLIR